MTKPHEKLEKDLGEALQSNKFIFLTHLQGVGKTWSSILTSLNKYRNTILINNTHELNDEINMRLMYDRTLKLDLNPAIINLFGKDFDNISPELQRERGYPHCMCNFHENPKYYLKKLNYFPYNWCSYPEKDERISPGHCPHIYECDHRKLIQEAIHSIKRKGHEDTHIIWLMVKAYMDTNMIDSFQESKDPVGIIDENILGLCFEQVSLKAYNIISFDSLAKNISRLDRSLKDIYNAMKDIFKLITNYCTFDREVDIKIKAKKITEKIVELLGSYKISDIREWNSKFKRVALQHPNRVKKTYNIMNSIIKILENNEKDVVQFEKNIFMHKDYSNISLFISKIERIREIVHKFHKLIFSDALLPTVITEMTTLLQIEDDYKVLHNTGVKAKWKEVRVLKLNSQRGSYKKNTLLNLMKDGVSDSFTELVKKVKHIIQYESERGRNKGLIGSMKIMQHNSFDTNLQKEIFPTIERYDMDVAWDHYGNAEGKNSYSNVDWIILFGGYNTPERVRNILSEMVGIDFKKLEYLHGPGTLMQFAHRGRPIRRPDEVSLYSLTNDIQGCFPQEKWFRDIPQIVHKDLLQFISDGKTTTQVMEYLGKSRQSTLNILAGLKNNHELVKTEKKSFGRGPPSIIHTSIN